MVKSPIPERTPAVSEGVMRRGTQSGFIPGLLVALLALTLAPACQPGRPEGKTIERTADAPTESSAQREEAEGVVPPSHAVDAPPAYEIVLDGTRVHRLDLVFTPEQWSAVQATLPRYTELEEEFGEDFSRLSAACDGMEHYDTCMAMEDERASEGRCRGMDDGLACITPARSRSLKQVLRSPDEYATCTVKYGGLTWTNVGFRFKGGITFRLPYTRGREQKLPFRLHLDRPRGARPSGEKQSLYGFRKLTFANASRDQSFVRDKLANELYQEFGVPAPRAAFYRVHVDTGEGSTYHGLFTMIEDPDGPLLKDRFSDGSGTLYKPTTAGMTWQGGADGRLTRKTRGPGKGPDLVAAVLDALHADLPAAEWRAQLESVFDVDLFLRWLAVTVVLGTQDTYGFHNARNYYVYAEPGESGRLKWIPWDSDLAFKVHHSASLSEVPSHFPLVRKLMDDPVFARVHREHLRAVLEGPGSGAALLARATELRELVRPHVVGPEGEREGYSFLRSERQFERSHENLRRFIAAHQVDLLAQLDALDDS